MKIISTILLCTLVSIGISQTVSTSQKQESSKSSQISGKMFFISSTNTTPLLYNRLASLNINEGKSVDDIFEPEKNCSVRKSGQLKYESYKNDKDTLKTPLGGSVAGMAYDYKSKRLFYVPMYLSELRYMDMSESNPCFTFMGNQSLNLLHNRDDVANQISRMTIGANGFGYALTNDGEHLIKFSTQGTPIIQDLGVLIDNPTNQVLVRSSCTSWGGDMVADVYGNLYLVTARNHIFKISLPSKKCDYLGMIKNLPEGFSSNGASVDEKGELIVSCGASIGKNFSPIYKVNWSSLEAKPIGDKIKGIGNISDMASSNLLFQKTEKEGEREKETSNTVIAFSKSPETDVNNLPDISIFPNPIINGRFQIRTNNMKEKGVYKMILIDITGKPIMEGKMNIGLKASTNSFNFPARHAKGVYVVQITDVFNRTIYSQQLIVE